MLKIQKNVSLKKFTTFALGGPAKFFTEAFTQSNLIQAINFAKENDLPYFILGGGSNLLISDAGFPGLVIKNGIAGIKQKNQSVVVGSGTILQELVNFTIRNHLAGMDKLYGIPGTVGGAIFGNAGAYGQTISDYITRVLIFDP